jgi:hypothetical protein
MRSISNGLLPLFTLMVVAPVLALEFGWEAFFPVAMVSALGAMICFMQNMSARVFIEQLTTELTEKGLKPDLNELRIRRGRHSRRVELVALLVLSGLLILLIIRNAEPGSICPRIFQVTVDTKGNCCLHGLPLSNPILRRTLFQVIAVSGGEVDMNLFPGWSRNPSIKSNVFAVSEDIEHFGLSAGDIALRKQMERHK